MMYNVVLEAIVGVLIVPEESLTIRQQEDGRHVSLKVCDPYFPK